MTCLTEDASVCCKKFSCSHVGWYNFEVWQLYTVKLEAVCLTLLESFPVLEDLKES